MKVRFLHVPVILALLCYHFNIYAQVQTARYVSMNANTNAYYEYLPQGYDPSGTERYPLLLFLHGMGELGAGTSSSLPTVLRNGPPKLINQGSFPASFTVGGHTFRFIVISPQFINWPKFEEIDAVIDYIEAHYKVDPTRVYVTGLSMGGGATWEYGGCSSNLKYVQRVAAIVPVCGASSPSTYRARTIATYNLPVWALHNSNDPTVPVSYTNDYIAYINQPPAPDPPAKKTIFNASGHDAWSKAYDPAYREDGKNVYEWMLQYSRPAMAESPLPVVLSDYKITRTGTGKVLVSWATSFEQNNAYFTIERSADGTRFTQLGRISATNAPGGSAYSFTDEYPLQGAGYYRLIQTDVDGKTTVFSVKQIDGAKAAGTGLNIYPNPAHDHIELTLQSTATGQIKVSVLDQGGKIIQTAYFYKQQALWKQPLSVSGLSAGFYLVEVKDPTGKRFVERFVKK